MVWTMRAGWTHAENEDERELTHDTAKQGVHWINQSVPTQHKSAFVRRYAHNSLRSNHLSKFADSYAFSPTEVFIYGQETLFVANP